jgi:hypothetical protein
MLMYSNFGKNSAFKNFRKKIQKKQLQQADVK